MKQTILLTVSCLLLSTFGAAMSGKGTIAIIDTIGDRSNDQGLVFKLKLKNSSDQTVSILMVNSGVEVIGYDGDELKIESKNYVPPSQQKEGLKPIYNQTTDNTNLGLSVVANGNRVTVTQASLKNFRYTIHLPNTVSLTYEEVGDQGEDLAISDMSGEIEVKVAGGNATLTNVAGPVIANSTNSDLKVIFSNLKSNKPCALTSINGSIDIALAPLSEVTLKLRSVKGEIFTDFAIEFDTSSPKPTITGGHNISGKVNGGGAEITVNNVNNDIFIRKKK